MTNSWHSYPKVYALGHNAIGHIFSGTQRLLVEEKIDGSQFSFGVFNGKIHVRSKGRVFEPDAADDMFKLAVQSVHDLAPLLHDGWTYRAEYLRESNRLEGSPHDIGALIKELVRDIETECAIEIKQQLWEWAWPKIKRASSHGFPEWYKRRLALDE